MTCYPVPALSDREAIRVESFATIPAGLSHQSAISERTRARHALVRVTHASIGVTDVMATRGDYLLHPVPGFVPGYDFVGIVEHLPAGSPKSLRLGQRVAGVLPRMGAHATVVSVKPSLLVPVPEVLDSLAAATIPLDAVTAWFALDMLTTTDTTPDLLVQGAGGAVGSWAVQLASRRGHTVYGTASSRSREHAQTLGARVFDYADPDWTAQVVDASEGGVFGAMDHTGGSAVRAVVARGGRAVRTAFGGQPGKQRTATARGFLACHLRRFARPGERVCSVPMLLTSRRSAYRQALTGLFDAVVAGSLVAPQPRLYPVGRYADAMAAAAHTAPGDKTVLTFE